jgi:hypothetical protein
MKRIYEIRAEKVVYYRKEVVLDTDDWDQIDDLLAGICEQEYSNWAEVPADIQQEVIEAFEATLEDEDVPDNQDCYDTEEWCQGTEWSLFEEEKEAVE